MTPTKDHQAYVEKLRRGLARDMHADVDEALEAARSILNGPERSEALKKAGLLRREADARGVVFAKRGRPRK